MSRPNSLKILVLNTARELVLYERISSCLAIAQAKLKIKTHVDVLCGYQLFLMRKFPGYEVDDSLKKYLNLNGQDSIDLSVNLINEYITEIGG